MYRGMKPVMVVNDCCNCHLNLGTRLKRSNMPAKIQDGRHFIVSIYKHTTYSVINTPQKEIYPEQNFT